MTIPLTDPFIFIMVKTLGLLAYATVLLTLAICCILFPKRVQKIAIKAVNSGLPSRFELIKSYMRMVNKFVQSSGYLISLQMIGVL